jgi:hypothetical protein
MENIALEECFGIPELAERRSDADHRPVEVKVERVPGRGAVMK